MDQLTDDVRAERHVVSLCGERVWGIQHSPNDRLVSLRGQ